MEWSPVAIAFTLTLLAGLATGIGSALALFARTTNTRFLSAALGFSAGVMIYVSFVEILADARASLAAELGARPGAWVTVLAFFGGIGLTALIDRLVPAAENPHEVHRVEEMHGGEGGIGGPTRTSCAWAFSPPRPSPSTTSRKASPPSWPRSTTRSWGRASPPPSPSTTSPRASRWPSPSSTRRGAASGPSPGRSSPASPSPWAPSSPGSCSRESPAMRPRRPLRRGRRRHGVHLLRRAPADRPRVRGASRGGLRPHLRHGGDGGEPRPDVLSPRGCARAMFAGIRPGDHRARSEELDPCHKTIPPAQSHPSAPRRAGWPRPSTR